MSYFKLRRSRFILAAFVSFAALAMLVPAIDLRVSALFFDGIEFPTNRWWQTLQQHGLTALLCLSMLTVTFVYAWNRLLDRDIGGIDGRKVAYLFLVMIIGAGLIVNAGLKNNVGRARPRDVAEFGGTRQFTPAFLPSNECRTNCSFSSGDAAGGFFTIALVMALARRRAWYLAAGAFGGVICVSRLASGAHFLTDTVTSFFVMLIVSDALRFYLLVPGPATAPSMRMSPAAVPAP
jgi:lipid A 4'-phosphatase